jgi:hypothetical protein
MGATIGELLPLAVGVAISPVPIIATILMLLAPRARAASAGFAAGWLVGIVVVVTVVAVIAASADLGGTSDEPSTGASWVKLVLGVLLVLLAGRQWSSRPRGDQPASLPAWMAAIDSMTVGKSAGLGFLLAAVNPKNLLLCLGAGVTLAGSGLSGGDQVVAGAVFVVIAASSVLVPVLGYALAAERLRGPLDELRGWLVQNNVAVMAVLLLVIGVALLGKGLGGLT